jgi:hypothetical protein
MQQYKCISILLFFHGWFAQVQNQAILAELDLSLMCWPSTIGPPKRVRPSQSLRSWSAGPSIRLTSSIIVMSPPSEGKLRGDGLDLCNVSKKKMHRMKENMQIACLICTIRWRLIFDSVMHFTVQNGQCIAQCLTTWALTV